MEKVCVLGLGYVGLPLVCELSKYFEVFGFDISKSKVEALSRSEDNENILDGDVTELAEIKFSSNIKDFHDANVFIICVPTPIKSDNTPDLTMIQSASDEISKVLKKGDLVINESTVYPGVTEGICAGIIKKHTGLIASLDYDLGYSPERINPGDKINRLDNTVKIISGGSEKALKRVENIYKPVTNNNTYSAQSIKVAEAAKALENIQRDVNIALVNEVSKIFSKLEISTHAVLDAADTKWNFHKYSPGLVGGHCISVDPYYLLHCSKQLGCSSTIIEAARNINESMIEHIANLIVQSILRKSGALNGVILLYGLSFKENVGDFRNSKAISLVRYLRNMGMTVLVNDPYIDMMDGDLELASDGVIDLNIPYEGEVAAAVIAVGHEQYKAAGSTYFSGMGDCSHPVLDLKNIFPKEPDFITL